jgi:prepilin-type N-terminal cleavage/methylation domain-containing protein
MKRRDRSGFTLIELIIVVGIIGVLVTVLLAVLLSATGAGHEKTAMNFVDNIIPDAIEKWREANGKSEAVYPRSPNLKNGKEYVEGNVELYIELVKKPEDAGKEAFVGKDHYTLGDHNGKGIFVDPWGTPYIYRNYVMNTASASRPRIANKTYNDTYDIISCGPDGDLDTDDDIYRGKR